MRFIDAHVHVWTPDTAHYPLAAGYKKEDMKPASFTPEELFKHTQAGRRRPHQPHPDELLRLRQLATCST